MRHGDVVIGIDGGGTHTRVIAADTEGNILASCKKGSASLYRDSGAQHNVRSAIKEVLERGNIEPDRVAGLAAGVAGYDSPEDLDWIIPLTDVPGLSCPRWHVNDALTAHYGALLAKPGIIANAGTGSIIIAVTEDGRYLRNYDFHQYAPSAARLLSYEAVFEVLAGQTDHSDERLIARMLAHWKVTAVSGLYELASQGFDADREARDKCFGRFAPAVTEEAERGSSAALRVCERAAQQMKTGIELLAAAFAGTVVSVALIGSVANSRTFQTSLQKMLKHGANRQYNLVTPQLPPVAGAVLYALGQLGRPVTDKQVSNLKQSKLLLQ